MGVLRGKKVQKPCNTVLGRLRQEDCWLQASLDSIGGFHSTSERGGGGRGVCVYEREREREREREESSRAQVCANAESYRPGPY
jgi:hypothetical protein